MSSSGEKAEPGEEVAEQQEEDKNEDAEGDLPEELLPLSLHAAQGGNSSEHNKVKAARRITRRKTFHEYLKTGATGSGSKQKQPGPGRRSSSKPRDDKARAGSFSDLRHHPLISPQKWQRSTSVQEVFKPMVGTSTQQSKQDNIRKMSIPSLDDEDANPTELLEEEDSNEESAEKEADEPDDADQQKVQAAEVSAEETKEAAPKEKEEPAAEPSEKSKSEDDGAVVIRCDNPILDVSEISLEHRYDMMCEDLCDGDYGSDNDYDEDDDDEDYDEDDYDDDDEDSFEFSDERFSDSYQSNGGSVYPSDSSYFAPETRSSSGKQKTAAGDPTRRQSDEDAAEASATVTS